MKHGAELVAAELREADRERYFSTLFQPASVRPHVQALFAFNAEIAAIRERVRDPAAGEIRLAWWRDLLAGTPHGGAAGHAVALALQQALATYGLPKAPLLRLLEARRFDLYDDPMPDLAGFEGYAGETNSVLYQLNAAMLAGGAIPEQGDAAGHLGVAHALVGHLAAVRRNAAGGRIFLPGDVLRAAGVDDVDILAGRTGPALAAAVDMLCDIAAEHLARAEEAIAGQPLSLRPAFSLMPVLRAQLAHQRRSAPLAAVTALPDWRKLWLMGRWVWRQR